MLPRKWKKHSCLPVCFQICEPTGILSCLLAGILARLPVHWPASLPALVPTCRHAGIEMVTKPKSWHHPSDRKSSSKVWQRTPQAATQRQRDTTFEKAPFLCRRNSRHACLLTGKHPCLPASPPALVPAGTQAYRQRHGGKAKGRTLFPMGETPGKAVERVAKERHKLPRQRQMLPRTNKGIQPLRKSLSFAGETVGTPACQSAYPCACRHTGIQAKGRTLFPMGETMGKAVERVAKERHKLPQQRQMLPRNGKEIQPWQKSFSFAGGMVGTPTCQPLCLPAHRQE